MPDISWSYLGIPFVCDSNKHCKNLNKHAVDLVRASTAFADPVGITEFDVLHSNDEDRFILIAKDDADVLLHITFTMRGDIIRIISARTATKKERKRYGAN